MLKIVKKSLLASYFRLDSSFKEFVAQKDISDPHYEDEILNLQVNLMSESYSNCQSFVQIQVKSKDEQSWFIFVSKYDLI